jgi:telomerase reverse transcriptase
MNCLQKTFTKVQSISDLLEATDRSPEFDQFLSTTFVCTNQPQFKLPKVSSIGLGHKQLIDQVINTLLKRKQTNNVLCYGYKTLSGNSRQGTINNIESTYPNTLVNILKGVHFQTLGNVIGEDAMIYLLQNTSIFMECGRGCLYQIIGKSLADVDSSITVERQYVKLKGRGNDIQVATDLKRKNDGLDIRKRKKTRLSNHVRTENTSSNTFTIKDNSTPISKTTQKVSLKHNLNSNLNPPPKKPKTSVVLWTQFLYSKPIFTQTGRIISSLPSNHSFQKSTITELVLSIFPQKTKKIPWRIKKIIPLMIRFVSRHQQCNYQALLDYYCPLPDKKQLKNAESLFEYHTRPYEIDGFLRSVLRRVVPLELFGKYNFELFIDGHFN